MANKRQKRQILIINNNNNDNNCNNIHIKNAIILKKMYTSKRNIHRTKQCARKYLNSLELRVALPKFYCSSGKIIKNDNTTTEEKEFDTLCPLTIPQVYAAEINF